MSRTRFGGRRNVIVAIFLTAGLVLGVGLVVIGGQDDSGGEAEAQDPAPLTTAAPLPLEDVSLAAVEDLSGLDFPADAQDFLTARLQRDTQLDVTFTMAPAAEAAFVSDSGLAAPEVGSRQILHSSPLWRINPDDDAEIRGTSSTANGVSRVVELVDEDPDTVRARIVITSAS